MVKRENRGSERFKLNVFCVIDNFNEDDPIEISNISSGGMFLMTDRPLPSNMELRFKILDDKNNLLYHGVGIIKWGTIIKNPKTNQVSRGCGIQFFEIIPFNQKKRFVEYLEEMYYSIHGKDYH